MYVLGKEETMKSGDQVVSVSYPGTVIGRTPDGTKLVIAWPSGTNSNSVYLYEYVEHTEEELVVIKKEK